MTAEETGLLDKQDFLEQKEVIKKQILGNGKLTGAEKRQTLQCWRDSENPSSREGYASTGSPRPC